VSTFDEELERARRVYQARATDPHLATLYEPLSPATLFTIQERTWVMSDLFRRSDLASLAGLDVLDVGCGTGSELQRLVSLGADPERMAGIDLMVERIGLAARRLPQARFVAGSAHDLPYPDHSFDLVMQFTLFSSVLDPKLRMAIAHEMKRVLRLGGRILWYDMRRARTSGDLVPIERREIEQLFEGWRIDLRAVTLDWRLVHRAAPRSRSLALLLQRLPALCSHYEGLLRPPVTRPVA
jgi:ubiquinone/menaquinone biosynthesis C-methylase UbiE